MHLVDSNGDQCGAGDPMVPNTTELNNQSLTCSSCGKVYELVQQLLVDLDTTEPCCLGNDTTCGNGTDHERTDPAKGILTAGLTSGGPGGAFAPPPLGFSLFHLKIYSTSNYVVCT